jgi:hypothetical protein
MMVMQKTFRSAMAKDILRYIRLKQALGRHFENGSRVLLSLDGFLSDLGKPSADLTPERFQKWGRPWSRSHRAPNWLECRLSGTSASIAAG